MPISSFCSGQISFLLLPLLVFMFVLINQSILGSSYRKLALVGSEPMATEFCSDALTNWAIRQWVIKIIESCTLISTNGYVLYLRYSVNKTPHTSRTFRRFLLVCIKTVFCNSEIFVSISVVFNLFSMDLAGVPRALTTNRIPVF